MTCDSPRQREPLVHPAFYPTDHLLDRAPEPGETDRRPIRTVAVWAGAIDHEDCAGLILGKIPLRDPPMRKVDRSWNVPVTVEHRTAHIEQHEALFVPGAAGFMHIPTVGLERQ